MNILDLIGRTEELFGSDIRKHEAELSRLVSDRKSVV